MTKPKTGKSSVKKVRKPKEKVAKITINPDDFKDSPTNAERAQSWQEFVKTKENTKFFDADFSEEERTEGPSLFNTVLALFVLGVIVYVVHHSVDVVL